MYLFRIVFLQCLYCFIYVFLSLCSKFLSEKVFPDFPIQNSVPKTNLQESKYLISLSILRLLHFFGKYIISRNYTHTKRMSQIPNREVFHWTLLSGPINMKTIKSKEFYVYIWYCRPEGRNMAQKHCTAEGNKVELVNFWKT